MIFLWAMCTYEFAGEGPHNPHGSIRPVAKRGDKGRTIVEEAGISGESNRESTIPDVSFHTPRKLGLRMVWVGSIKTKCIGYSLHQYTNASATYWRSRVSGPSREGTAPAKTPSVPEILRGPCRRREQVGVLAASLFEMKVVIDCPEGSFLRARTWI